MRNQVLLICFLLPAVCNAQTPADDLNRLFELPLNELLEVKVVTATGYTQPFKEAPAIMGFWGHSRRM